MANPNPTKICLRHSSTLGVGNILTFYQAMSFGCFGGGESFVQCVFKLRFHIKQRSYKYESRPVKLNVCVC